MKHIKNMDIWGSATSGLCAVHCALLPILLSIGTISSDCWMNSVLFEVIFIGFTLVFVGFSIVLPFLRHGNNKGPFLLAVSGLFLIVFHHSLMNGPLLVSLGGICVAAGHLWNLKFHNRPVPAGHTFP